MLNQYLSLFQETPSSKGDRVTIGLKSANFPPQRLTPSLPTPSRPSPTPVALPTQPSPTPASQRNPNFGQRFTAFAANPSQSLSFTKNLNPPQQNRIQDARFEVKSAVPVTTTPSSTVDRYQTAFTASTTTQSPFSQNLQSFSTSLRPQTPQTTAEQNNAQSRFQFNNQQQQQRQQQSVILPDITTTRRPFNNVQNTQQRENNLRNNGVILNQAPRIEQSRTLDIFENNRAEDSLDQSLQLLSNFNREQSAVDSVKTLDPPQQLSNVKQNSNSELFRVNSQRNLNNFVFEALPTKFSSSSAQNNQFIFGPPSQTINMRDGSYTIITLL